MQRRVDEEPVTMRGQTLSLSHMRGPLPDREGRFAPSAKRSLQDRERRYRERAIAAWLRDLSR